MDAKEDKVKASVETMAYYNMILTEAIFQLLEKKGILTREQVKERIEKLKVETKLTASFLTPHRHQPHATPRPPRRPAATASAKHVRTAKADPPLSVQRRRLQATSRASAACCSAVPRRTTHTIWPRAHSLHR